VWTGDEELEPAFRQPIHTKARRTIKLSKEENALLDLNRLESRKVRQLEELERALGLPNDIAVCVPSTALPLTLPCL